MGIRGADACARLWGPIGGFLVGASLLWFVLVRRNAWAILAAAMLAAFGLVFGSSAVKAERYLLPLVPVGLLFVGAAIAAIAARRTSRRDRLLVGLGLRLACLLPLLPGWAPVLGRQVSRLEARGPHVDRAQPAPGFADRLGVSTAPRW